MQQGKVFGSYTSCHEYLKTLSSGSNFKLSDDNAVIVNTGSSEDLKKRLSEYYHYDAASLLVIGNRIAKRLSRII